MDRLIKRFDAERDRDLMVSHSHGVAYQRDMSQTINYDAAYFDNYIGKTSRHPEVSESRVKWVEDFGNGPLLDIGIGSGDFILKRNESQGIKCTKGFDINPKAKEWLRSKGLWSDDFKDFKAFTFWDVIEHCKEPDVYFKHIPDDGWLFTSIPIIEDLNNVRKSKHFKPNEHLYYWTNQGFIDYMDLWGFRLIKGPSDHEVKAGRQEVAAYAFKKDLPDYHKTLKQYTDIHAKEHYGDSADLHFDIIAREVIRLNPKSVLDFGCGRSGLAWRFWNDGKRSIHQYDPAIPKFKEEPPECDLVLCTDVMEHILMRDVDRIFEEIKRKSKKVIFTISMKPARRKLFDGRNAHVTLLTKTEWIRWIKDSFGQCTEIPQESPTQLIVRTFE